MGTLILLKKNTVLESVLRSRSRPSQGGAGADQNCGSSLKITLVLVEGQIQQKFSFKKDPCCPEDNIKD